MPVLPFRFLPLALLGVGCVDPGNPTDANPVPLPSACADPVTALTYVEVAEAWGLSDTTDAERFPSDGSGVTVADLDEDGRDDVLLAIRTGTVVIEWNRGDHFESEPLDLGLTGAHAAAFDIDGDRHLDVLVSGNSEDGRWGFAWVLGDGAGGFTVPDHALALTPAGPALGVDAGDFDRDGDLDVYLAVLGEDALLVNDEDGNFTSAFDAHLGDPAWTRVSWAGMWADLDDNGWPDLFVGNDLQQQYGASRVYANAGGQLSEATAPVTVNAMGGSPLDYDNDGDIDLFVTGTGPDGLYQNQGGGAWVDVGAATGARGPNDVSRMHLGSAAVDFDNDGWTDIVAVGGRVGIDDAMVALQDAIEPDVLLHNDGGTFTELGASSGFSDDGDSRGVAVGDLDGDGMPDIVVGELGHPSRVYLGACNGNRALDVELVGVESNSYGLGARVEARTPAGTVRAWVGTRQGLVGNGPPRAHLGLGTAAVDGLTVYWPSGIVQDVEVAPDVSGRLRVEEREESE